MICPNCKESILDGSKFCEHCGSKVEQQPQNGGFQQSSGQQPQNGGFQQSSGQQPQNGGFQPSSGQQPQNGGFQPSSGQQPQNGGFQSPLMQKKAIDKRVFVALGVAVAVIILAIMLVATRKTKIDLNDYVKVEFSGYDTFGTATIDFDYDAFYKDMKEHAKVDKKTQKEMENALKELDLSSLSGDLSALTNTYGYLAACESVEWELDKTSELSNGEKVTLSFEFDNDIAKEFKIKFVGKEKKFEVSGLEEVRTIDPFADVEVTFSGTSPNVTASATSSSNDEAIKSLYFSVDPSYDIAKGDKVTVSVDADEQYMLEQYGCKLTATSKEYVCENVDEYIKDGADIVEETLESMKTQTKDVIESYFAGCTDSVKASNIKYVGYYFLANKDTSSWYERNITYIVYSAKVKSKESKFKETTLYLPVKFTDIIKYADGTEYVSMDYTSIQGTSSLQYGFWSHLSGYDKQNIMKNELVTAQKSNFTVATFGDLD